MQKMRSFNWEQTWKSEEVLHEWHCGKHSKRTKYIMYLAKTVHYKDLIKRRC